MDRIEGMACWEMEPDWIAEIENNSMLAVQQKFDGFRETVYFEEDGRIRVMSGTETDHSQGLPHLTERIIPELAGTILDTEGMGPTHRIESAKSVFGSGPEASRAWQEANGRGYLVAFDCMRFRGEDITQKPLRERLEYLTEVIGILEVCGIDTIHQIRTVTNGKREHYDAVVERGGEGIVVKDLDSLYDAGSRNKAWTKVKPVRTWDVVIVGFTPGQGKFEGLAGAICYGYYKNGILEHVGNSSGMTWLIRADMSMRPEQYVGRVVEIRGQEASAEGCIRFPRFVQMRDDKKAESCVWG